MLNRAIAVGIDRNNSIIETDRGDILVAPNWPQDCESQVVSYQLGSKTCHVVNLETLFNDIGEAMVLIERSNGFVGKKPDWFIRLKKLVAT